MNRKRRQSIPRHPSPSIGTSITAGMAMRITRAIEITRINTSTTIRKFRELLSWMLIVSLIMNPNHKCQLPIQLPIALSPILTKSARWYMMLWSPWTTSITKAMIKNENLNNDRYTEKWNQRHALKIKIPIAGCKQFFWF